MKLDKLERHTAYIIMLAEVYEAISAERSAFLCHIIYNNFKLTSLRHFSEIWDKKPEGKKGSNAWFKYDDYESRIQLLNECIQETY